MTTAKRSNRGSDNATQSVVFPSLVVFLGKAALWASAGLCATCALLVGVFWLSTQTSLGRRAVICPIYDQTIAFLGREGENARALAMIAKEWRQTPRPSADWQYKIPTDERQRHRKDLVVPTAPDVQDFSLRRAPENFLLDMAFRYDLTKPCTPKAHWELLLTRIKMARQKITVSRGLQSAWRHITPGSLTLVKVGDNGRDEVRVYLRVQPATKESSNHSPSNSVVTNDPPLILTYRNVAPSITSQLLAQIGLLRDTTLAEVQSQTQTDPAVKF